MLAEIIRSCSHAKVAEAAIYSIGPDFVRDVERRANARGLPIGRFVAGSVQSFARSASHSDWRRLAEQIAGADMPILSGLLHILETTHTDRRMLVTSTDAGIAHTYVMRENTAHRPYCP